MSWLSAPGGLGLDAAAAPGRRLRPTARWAEYKAITSPPGHDPQGRSISARPGAGGTEGLVYPGTATGVQGADASGSLCDGHHVGDGGPAHRHQIIALADYFS